MTKVAVFSNVLEPDWLAGAVSIFLEPFLFPFPFLRHFLLLPALPFLPKLRNSLHQWKPVFYLRKKKKRFGVGNKKFSRSKNNASKVSCCRKIFYQQKCKIVSTVKSLNTGLWKRSAKWRCPPNIISVTGNYTRWDQEKCPLNGGVRLIECLLQEVLLYNKFCIISLACRFVQFVLKNVTEGKKGNPYSWVK